MAGFASQERLAFGPWAALERMAARLLRHVGFTEVTVVGGSGDGGADVVGMLDGKRWVVQSKFRNSGGIGGSAVEEVVHALLSYGADVGVVLTNQYFIDDASQTKDRFTRSGVDLRLWSGEYVSRYYANLPSASAEIRVPRPYQTDAIAAAETARDSGRESALIVMATGLGKSLVAAELIAMELARNPKAEVLVLAHMSDLVRQLESSSWCQFPKEVATHLWTDGESPTFSSGVVFATWQSVSEFVKRGNDLAGRFGLVVVDEAHHAPSREFAALLEHLQPNFLLGLTATPWRGDLISVDEIFGKPVFAMDLVDGMQNGYLAEVDYRLYTDGIDWEKVAVLSRQGKTVRDLNDTLLMPERDLAMVEKIQSEMQALQRPRALAFCRTIEHAERLRPLFAQLGISAAVVHSSQTRQDRFRNLTNFRSGSISLLLSVDLLNEGIDLPEVNLVAFLRVTHSRRIFVQQLGRGLRLTSGKSSVRVMDFVADIRRVAMAVEINRQAEARTREREVVRFADGRIIKFSDTAAESFCNEYIADVAGFDLISDGAVLRFPGIE